MTWSNILKKNGNDTFGKYPEDCLCMEFQQNVCGLAKIVYEKSKQTNKKHWDLQNLGPWISRKDQLYHVISKHKMDMFHDCVNLFFS